MSALTVTLGADISALKRALAGATELVSASARRMGKMTGAGLAGLGKGGAAALGAGFSATGVALKAGIGAALAGGAAAMAVGVKAVTSAADFEQTKVAFTTLIGDAGRSEKTLAGAGRKLIAFGEGADTVQRTARSTNTGYGKHPYTVLPKNPGFLDAEKLCGFAPWREKSLNRGRCQRCRGVKSDSRKGAKAQRKMGSMLDSYIRDPQRENHRLTGQTNELLKDLNKTVEKLGGGAQAAFG